MKRLSAIAVKYNHLLFLLMVSLYAARSFFSGGFIPTHDGEYHIIRLWQFDKTITSGILFPRWAPDLNKGFGVPLFSYFYPLPNYIGELFHRAGFSFVDAVQLVLAIGLLISPFTFYMWMRCFVDKWQAVVGSVFYLLAPYHLVDVFVRGSVGEVWALTLTPLVLLFLTKLVRDGGYKNVAYMSLMLALLLLSHNIIGLMFFFFCLLYGFVIVYISKKQWYFKVLVSFTLGFLLTGFFWIPAALESSYVTGLQIVNVYDHFVAFFQLLIPSWGTGFSVPGVGDEISFQIGIPHILVLFIVGISRLKKKDVLAGFFVIAVLVSSYLTLEASETIWRLLPFLSYFQYPWRILSLTILAGSFLASYAAKFKSRLTIPLLIIAAMIFYLPYTNAVVYQKRADNYYLTNPNWTDGTATLGNTFNTIWFAGRNNKSKPHVIVISGEGSLQVLPYGVTTTTYMADAKTPLEVRNNIAYFPGWYAKIDGRYAPLMEDNGLMNLSIPQGKHSIIVAFGETKTRVAADMISYVTLIYVLYVLIKNK